MVDSYSFETQLMHRTSQLLQPPATINSRPSTRPSSKHTNLEPPQHIGQRSFLYLSDWPRMVNPQSQAQTPILDKFITSISQLVTAREGDKLQDYLQIEPEWPPIYYQMVKELRSTFPKDSPRSDAKILAKCERLGKGTWIAFPMFMRLYFTFLRDVDVNNLLETYNLLRALLKCVSIFDLAVMSVPRANS